MNVVKDMTVEGAGCQEINGTYRGCGQNDVTDDVTLIGVKSPTDIVSEKVEAAKGRGDIISIDDDDGDIKTTEKTENTTGLSRHEGILMPVGFDEYVEGKGNDYDLQSGEPSVWRETKKSTFAPKKKKVNDFINQDFCQACGDGGELILCPRCPVSIHAHCCGLHPDDFQCCNHHHCVPCGKNAVGAGGLLYCCQSCPSAYCPDCLPSGKAVRFLGTNVPRFEKLGFDGNALYQYIHCSKQCEEVAKATFGFKVDATKPNESEAMNSCAQLLTQMWLLTARDPCQVCGKKHSKLDDVLFECSSCRKCIHQSCLEHCYNIVQDDTNENLMCPSCKHIKGNIEICDGESDYCEDE